MSDFLKEYLHFVEDTEPHKFIHRWSAITSLGALLEDRYYTSIGYFKVNPNFYTMLLGPSGSRKSTAILIAKKVLSKAGYDYFSARKTSRAQFFLDLTSRGETEDDFLLGADIYESRTTPVFIVSGEFNTFFGDSILDFLSDLGELWDYEGVFDSKVKNSKSALIHNPIVSILGGNTPTQFAETFPVAAIGQGFFSRSIIVYAPPAPRKITEPEAKDLAKLAKFMEEIKIRCVGPSQTTEVARALLDKIYKTDWPLADVRFESYLTRRFTHLKKLCLIVSASRNSTEITESDVRIANTILVHTEQLMPKALGEFGKGKNSDVSHKILNVLEHSIKPMSLIDIWQHIYMDLQDHKELAVVMGNLSMAKKVQFVRTDGATGFLPMKRLVNSVAEELIDPSYLTSEERSMSI